MADQPPQTDLSLTVAAPASSNPVSKSPPANPVNPSYLWLRRSDQLAVGFLVLTLLILLSLHWARLSRWGQRPVELRSQQPREYYYSLDINTASWVEWAQLDGIGETLAKRIVADRDERGLFRSPDDLSRVRGIGPKVLERIRPYLLGGTTASSTDEDFPLPNP